MASAAEATVDPGMRAAAVSCLNRGMDYFQAKRLFELSLLLVSVEISDTQNQAAAKLKISCSYLSRIINGKTADPHKRQRFHQRRSRQRGAA